MNYENNSSFSESIPMLQIAWDSTSLGLLKECPRKYYYTNVLGRKPRDESVHLIFGAHYHKALETYDHFRSRGADFDEAQDQAVKYCLEATCTHFPDGRFRLWLSDEPTKTRTTLIRTVIWYLEQFKDDPLETIQLANGKPAVELSFRFDTQMESPSGENFVLCGHIDRLVEADGEVCTLDRKTSKQTISPDTFKKFSPDNQMSLYDFAGNVVWKLPVKKIIIDAAQVAVGFARFQRGFVRRTAGDREEWFKTALMYIQMAVHYAEQKFWPMNDKSCGNYGGCPFREVCSKGPETRDKWLGSLTKKHEWDPLKVRGDI